MTDDLVAKLRDEDSYYRLQEKHWCIDAEELERQRLAAADRIEALEAENEQLREALEPFTFRNLGDDEVIFLQYPSIIVRCEVTYGDIQLARAALGDKQ